MKGESFTTESSHLPTLQLQGLFTYCSMDNYCSEFEFLTKQKHDLLSCNVRFNIFFEHGRQSPLLVT